MAAAVTTLAPAKPAVALRFSRRYPAIRHRNLLVALRERGTRFLVAWARVRKPPELGKEHHVVALRYGEEQYTSTVMEQVKRGS